VIREIQLGTASPGEHVYHEPPSGVLRVCIVGDDAHLDWDYHGDPEDEQQREAVTHSFRVPARSLLLALQAVWTTTPGPPASTHPLPTPAPGGDSPTS
jgi:hypothetical protein